MSATSSAFHAHDFERRYLKPRRGVMVSRSAKIPSVEKLADGWPAVRAISVIALAVCGASIAKFILGLF